MTSSSQSSVASTGLELTETNWIDSVVEAMYSVFGAQGHKLFPPGPLIPRGDTSTLYTTASIQHWRDWVLSPSADSDRGRIGPQWCVRMTALEKVGSSNFLTSFCLLSCLTRGRIEREKALGLMIEVLDSRWGLAFERLAFVATAEGPEAPEDTASLKALDRLGVSRSRYTARPRKWAHPFKPHGPAGPELFVLFDITQTPCGPECGPLCGCGRFIHFWNLEFLENRRLITGETETVQMPFLDSAGSIEWVVGAITRTNDLYNTPPFRRILSTARSLLTSTNAFAAPDKIKILCDHARTIALALEAGVEPGAKKQGHVLRRLIRRSLAVLSSIDADLHLLPEIVAVATEAVRCASTSEPRSSVSPSALTTEIELFRTQLNKARKVYDSLLTASELSAESIFDLNSSFGAPWGVIRSWLQSDGVTINEARLAEIAGDNKLRSRGR